MEALESASQKKVNVNISEDNGMINISVDNVSPFISSEEMMTFFHRGVSTKGKNRGIGLAKLQKTAEKYDGKMNILIREYKSSDAEYASEI
ncbi:GHKL domain-containing protein [Lachnospiraceae bacterium HCP1S3_C3]